MDLNLASGVIGYGIKALIATGSIKLVMSPLEAVQALPQAPTGITGARYSVTMGACGMLPDSHSNQARMF